jgi:hypothetical protein
MSLQQLKPKFEFWLRWLRQSLPRAAAILIVAAIMSVVGNHFLNRARYEDIGSGLLFSTDPRFISPAVNLLYLAASCLTWTIISPFMSGKSVWSVIPGAIVAPFLGSALVAFGILLLGGLAMGPFGIASAVVVGSGVTFLAWTFILNSARVMLPTGLVTGMLIWVLLNRVLPPNIGLNGRRP